MFKLTSRNAFPLVMYPLCIIVMILILVFGLYIGGVIGGSAEEPKRETLSTSLTSRKFKLE